MTDICILAENFRSYKTQAFLFPILRYQRELEAEGYCIDVFVDDSDEILSCDILMVCDQFYTGGNPNRNIIEDLNRFSEHVDQIFWFDTTDGTTVQTYGCFSASVQRGILPLVDRYYKKQLLIDRSRYLKPIKEGRLFTDYYRSEKNIPGWSHGNTELNRAQIKDKNNLEKLGLYWNLSFNIQLPLLNHVISNIIQGSTKIPTPIVERVPWNKVVNFSPIWADPDRHRPVSIAGRYSTSYDSNAIQYHRKLMKETLANRVDFDRVSTTEYWKELRRSQLLLSPFGWGEICHRDFEGWMSGCAVIKPHMDHLETWPPLYEDGKTILSFDWDMGNLEETIDAALGDPQNTRKIAETGQERYRNYLVGQTAKDEFIKKFKSVVECR